MQWSSRDSELTPRTSIQIPREVADELKEAAKSYRCSVSDILRKCIQLGLLSIEIEKDKNRSLIIRSKEGGQTIDETIRLLIWVLEMEVNEFNWSAIV